MNHGFALHSDGSTTEPTSLKGFGIIQAEDAAEARSLLKDHPLFSAGDDYTIEVFEVPKM